VPQCGATAARKDGGELPRVSRRSAVAEQVNPAMERMEPPRFDAAVDGVPTQAHRQELAAGDHTMLACRERGDLLLAPDPRAANYALVGRHSFVVGSTGYTAVNPAPDFGAP